jgi:hypothetical protein
MVFIAEQGKLKVLPIAELFLFYWRISRTANNLYIIFFKFLEFIPESLAFYNSTRRAGFWEKP